MKEKNPAKGMYFALFLLLFGMTVGFILLSTVYTGPRIWAVLVYIVYIVIVVFSIKSVRKFVKALNEKEDGSDDQ